MATDVQLGTTRMLLNLPKLRDDTIFSDWYFQLQAQAGLLGIQDLETFIEKEEYSVTACNLHAAVLNCLEGQALLSIQSHNAQNVFCVLKILKKERGTCSPVDAAANITSFYSKKI